MCRWKANSWSTKFLCQASLSQHRPWWQIPIPVPFLKTCWFAAIALQSWYPTHTSSLPNLLPGKKKNRHYPPSFMQNIYIHTYIFIYTHTYTQHLREGRDYFHCYRNWGIKNPSVSKAGAAPDVQSFYWLEQLTLFLLVGHRGTARQPKLTNATAFTEGMK